MKAALEADDGKVKGAAGKGLTKPSAAQVAAILKEKLISRVCRNQGYVLDAFPENVEHAKALFPEPKKEGEEEGEEEAEPEEEAEEGAAKKVKFEVRLAEFLLLPDTSDELLKERIMTLSESEAGAENTEEGTS